jgi:hypothetical protein
MSERHCDQVPKSAKMKHWSARDATNTDSYIALQELPAGRMITSMAECSQNDIVVTVEKDWYICFKGDQTLSR